MPTRDWPGDWLRARLGYEPREPSLFESALTHRSAGSAHYERLEFLGDAVVNLVVAERLYSQYPDATEGDLSRLRARLVSEDPLAEIAQSIGLGDALQLGTGEQRSGGYRRQSILADGFEAVCGALFLDGGFAAVRAALDPLFAARIAELPDPGTLKDAKTRLQEHLQGRGMPLPRYALTAVDGEPHEQTFVVSCDVPGLGTPCTGTGSTRRRAEQAAAELALARLAATP
jgi:ribonuclease-3